jgi:predicted ArsR family transcriptional regulator
MAKRKPKKRNPPKARASRTGSKRANRPTKQAQLIELLRRPEGATLEQMSKALGWQRHSVRGAMATLKTKQAASITSEKPADGPRIYRTA